MDEKCVVCGSVIPEGRQVCPACERQQHRCPCMECTRRTAECHGSCTDYTAWRQYRDKVGEWLRGQHHNSRMASQRFIDNIKRKARGWTRKGGNGE